MSHRFRRPSISLTSPTSRNCGRGSAPECRCCAAIQRTRETALFDELPECGSPLTPGMQLVNLSSSEDGRVLRADLSTDWAVMFAQLHLAGQGLVMTRNAAAILGRRMLYPAMNVTAGDDKGASGDGGLWLDFRLLGAARAIHLRGEHGHVFGVEFADRSGNIAHRLTLTPESNLDEFFAWVRLHQACSAHSPAVWRRAKKPATETPGLLLRDGVSASLSAIVATCVNQETAIRATVRAPAVTQRAEFTPRSLERTGDWWFASDDETGLHFQPDLFSRTLLEERILSSGDRHVALRSIAEDGSSSLVLEAGSPEAEGDWRDLLENIA